jgi:DNA-3-methyladenine glycosylase II
MKKAFDNLQEKEIIFKSIIDNYGLPQIPFRPKGFETLVLLILEQQVSINSAKATFEKLTINFQNLTPEYLFNVSDENFRQYGVSRQNILNVLQKRLLQNQ